MILNQVFTQELGWGESTDMYSSHLFFLIPLLEDIIIIIIIQITDVTSFYKWTTNIVYPALFPENDNAGSRLRWIDKKFINDGVNMKIGPLRMRQLRIQNPGKPVLAFMTD